MMVRGAALVILLQVCVVGKKKDWKSIDLEKVAEEWAQSDEAEELETEHDAYEKEVNRRKAAMGGGGLDLESLKKMKPDDIKSRFAHQQSNAGMAMIFVTLSEYNDGEPWTTEAEDKIAGVFTALLQTGGLKVSAYRIDPRRLLVTMQTGWYGRDVIDFMLTQPKVMKCTWDNTDYVNPDVPQVEPPPREQKPHPPPKKKSSKSKKKKKKKEVGGDGIL
ncbi:hypothetical protein CTAYLR_005416 [Chrysophaeum taylorii]|uniref:Mesoderm development candidate 2 n=1 Tax=Chrysophaeum taylorii TaxID=2483200 RepID=A0AAD7U8A0_9STRA|nr:hypothetical protein CTAYLR_005416 [Chrysophaeum taylorii]